MSYIIVTKLVVIENDKAWLPGNRSNILLRAIIKKALFSLCRHESTAQRPGDVSEVITDGSLGWRCLHGDVLT